MKQNDHDLDEYPSTLEMLINLFIQWRKVIFLSVLSCMLVSTVVAFLITPKFKSTATVFPAERTDLFGALEGVSSQLKSLSSAKGLGALGGSTELDKFMIILKSGRVLGAVINRFDLVHVYNIKSYPMEKTVLELIDNVDFSTEEESSLSITVFDEDPQRAADMANYFVAELSRTNTELQLQNARSNRGFIEERYKKNLSDIAAAADSLKLFQKKYGVLALPEQLEASIKTIADISAQLAIKEVEANVLKKTQTSDNSMLISAQIEIDELQKKLSQINNGTAFGKDDMKVIVPFSKMPDLGSEYLRLYRDVEIQYKILQFITPIYEQAKVEEQRNTPSVVILDRAVPAERKTKPKRLLIILGGMLIGFMGTFVFAVLHNKWKNEQTLNTPLYRSSVQLITGIQADLRSLRMWVQRKRE
jgi:tyrosine-protein kinase Etk/Wzc